MIYASVENGNLILGNHDDTERSFSLDDKGNESLAHTLMEWGWESVMCSSSVDFAKEYGAPEDMDVGEWIGSAQSMAAALLGLKQHLLTLEAGQLEEMLQRLRDGKIDEVVSTLNTWIAQAKGE